MGRAAGGTRRAEVGMGDGRSDEGIGGGGERQRHLKGGRGSEKNSRGSRTIILLDLTSEKNLGLFPF